jgi:hypothetical protein
MDFLDQIAPALARETGMHARFVVATLVVLLWATIAHAQWRDRERFPGRFHDRERSLPPAFVPSGPGHVTVDDHAMARHPATASVKTTREADGPICDKPDNDPDAAIVACGRIITRGQVKHGYSLVVAYAHRGQAYENKSDHGHAIADFSDAIRLDPKVPGYYAMRGAAAEKSGDSDAARNDFQRTTGLDPKNQDALNGLKRIATRSASPASTAVSASPLPPAPGDAPSPPVVTVAQLPIATALPAASVAASVPRPAARASSAAPESTASPVVSASASSVATASASTAPATPNVSNGPRVALVIGNGAYVNANVLPNPPNDAHAVAGVLRQIGFDVQEGENLDHATMEKLLHEFLHKASSASVVLLFYAGHGMQVDGKNYLVPVDAKLAEPSDLPFETVEIDKLLESLGDPGHTNIILLDACRDNPLARSFASHLPATRSAAVSTGLAPYSAIGTGTLIAYATAPGQTALDGKGKDSPFTTSLLHFLPTPGMEIRQVLTRVRAEVASVTGNRQIPWDNSSLMGDVVLVAQDPLAKKAEH